MASVAQFMSECFPAEDAHTPLLVIQFDLDRPAGAVVNASPVMLSVQRIAVEVAAGTMPPTDGCWATFVDTALALPHLHSILFRCGDADAAKTFVRCNREALMRLQQAGKLPRDSRGQAGLVSISDLKIEE